MKTKLNLNPIAVLVALTFVLITSIASAQTKTITGVIRDESQNVMVGVSVSVKGTAQGVLTADDGRFSISVDPSKYNTLVFSFIGKKTIELSVAEKSYLELTMADQPTELVELTIIGAGTSGQLYTELKSEKKSARKAKRLF